VLVPREARPRGEAGVVQVPGVRDGEVVNYPRGRDFVPEAYPRPERSWDTTEHLFVSQEPPQGPEQVRECPWCGEAWDQDGPEVCPACEDFTVVLPGATFDSPEGG